MNYTPGPWETREIAGNGANIPARMEIVAPEGEGAKKLIANIYGFSLPTGRANARLIAAAPELYEALREILDYVRLDYVREVYAQFGGDDEKRGRVPRIKEDIVRVEALLKRLDGEDENA